MDELACAQHRIERSKTMIIKKRSRPTIVRKAEDKAPQAPLPEDGKSQPTWKGRLERLDLKDEPAAKGFAVEDEDWIAFEDARSRLKEALGIDDDDFCTGIVRQLQKLTNWGGCADQDDFNFLLSVLKDARPVDKLHTLLHVQMAICHLCAMKQTEVLLQPVRFELPADFQLAMHNAKYDTRRLDKRKIRVDDLPLRQSGERSVRGLMQTFVLQLQTSVAYRKDHEQSVKVQPVYVSASGQKLLTDGTKAARRKTQKDPATRSSPKQNGSDHSAAGTDSSKQVNIQKSNGHASS
jgi:hypothetical protein